MIEIDMKKMKARMERARVKGDELTHWKGRTVGTFQPVSLERRARDEAEKIMQTAGCGALFNVYSQLAERYKSLVVLLPVAQISANQNIAKVLTQLQLVASNNGKIYCLPWIFGVKTADLAQSFASDAEKAIIDTREMLVYATHLIQLAGKEMIREQKDYAQGWEQYRKRRGISDETNERHCVPQLKRTAKTYSNANFLFVEHNRVYDYVTSAFTKQIADSQGAWKEHQKWQRELLLKMQQDDPADAGGYGMSQSTGR